MAKVCFITAIYGGYEQSCKKFETQTIPADFICFTDNENILSNGWIIDSTPYHLTCKSPIDNDTYVNSLCNNKHSFNKAKYYKQAFQNIPRLAKYEVVVWLDGTVQVVNPQTAAFILENIGNSKIIGWHHEKRSGVLEAEVTDAENFYRYSSTYWNNQEQPYQDVRKQYKAYVEDGYDENFFKSQNHPSPHFGVWITCFVAFHNKSPEVSNFLDTWYLQTLKYTTQDQVGFPYVVQKTGLIPITLPQQAEHGLFPHLYTLFYFKHNHGI
jgi:hypothetical protein